MILRAPFTGDYAGMLALGEGNALVPGDVITETNTWGAFFFTLAPTVTNVRISITGAAGSATDNDGGTGGTGTFDMAPAFLISRAASGFWVVLGEAGRPSAGETSPISDFVAYNGGGAGTDWSNGEGTYNYAAGGGGASDVRLDLPGASMTNPQTLVDTCATTATRFAIVGGGGGATDNDGGSGPAEGGYGGGFNSSGGDGGYVPFGTGATTSAAGLINGALCRGGNGDQDGTEGWAGGGGGGYYGGGAPTAHGAGGGGSGYLLTDPALVQVSTSDGTKGGNMTTTRHGAFTITVN